MSRKSFLIFVAVSCVIAVISGITLKSRKKKTEYAKLIQGSGRLSSIEFTRQKTDIRVEEGKILRDFEDAFKHPSNSSKGGSTYRVCITFVSGDSVFTDIYIRDDKKGFQIADYYHVGAGDPRYVIVDFPETISNETKELLEELTWTRESPRPNKIRNIYDTSR